MSGTLRPRVVVLQGDRILTVRELPPDHEWHLGRRPDSPLPLAERSISRHHARLYCDGAGTHLEDLGTPNGTWLDGIPLRGSALLRDGQVIRLGQSTNPDPILLRFEDPASRLLAAITRPSQPSEPGEPPASGSGPTDIERAEPGSPALPDAAWDATTRAPAGDAAGETALEGSPTGGSGAELDDDSLGSPRQPFLGLGMPVVIGACLAFVAVFWLLWALKSTQKPWQSVRVEPLRAQPGSRISIRGSEVEPEDTLKVLVDAQEARVEKATLGQLVIVVPELPTAEAGTRTVQLSVERRGIVVLKQGLQYETAPSIERIEPADAAVGDTVALVGAGFVADASLVQVQIGDKSASVVRAAPRRLEVRIPVVTRSGPVDVPVEIEIQGLRSTRFQLRVRPRDAPCFALSWSGRAVAPRVFEVVSGLGPVLLVEGTARRGAPPDELPAAARRAVDTLQAAFATPPTAPVRFEVDERGRAPQIVVTGLRGSRVVAAFGPAVKELLRERVPELRQPELILYWQAAILNELHELFVKQQQPRVLPETEPIGALLRRLYQLSLETGGSGCPAAAEIETLTEDERRSLEAASLRVPSRFGDVAGIWEGSFESAATDLPAGAGLEMQLELEQTGTRLDGRLFLFEVRGPGIRWSRPPLTGLRGRVRLDAGTQVELRLPAVPPHDIIQLSGTVSDDVMSGIYRTARGKSGPFNLTYKATR